MHNLPFTFPQANGEKSATLTINKANPSKAQDSHEVTSPRPSNLLHIGTPLRFSLYELVHLSSHYTTMAAIQPKPTSSRLTSLLAKLPRLEFYNSSPSILLLTFKPFPRLPRELRNIICGMIASEPRVVKVIDAVAVQIWKSAVEGQSRQPAVMHVNQESRSEGARFYTLCREKTRREVCRNEQWRKLRTWSRLKGNLVHINFEMDEFLLVPFDRTWVYRRRSNVNCMSKKLAVDRYNFGLELLEKIMRMAFENGSVCDWILDLLPVMNCHEYILRKSWNFDEKSTPLEEDIRKRYLARRSLVLLDENMTWHVSSKIPCKDLQIKLQWM